MVTVSSRRRGNHVNKVVQKELNAEVGQGTAEENRRNFTSKKSLLVKLLASQLQKFQFLVKVTENILRNHRGDFFGLGVHYPDFCLAGAMIAALEKMQSATGQLIHALEILATAQGPVHGYSVHV